MLKSLLFTMLKNFTMLKMFLKKKFIIYNVKKFYYIKNVLKKFNVKKIYYNIEKFKLFFFSYQLPCSTSASKSNGSKSIIISSSKLAIPTPSSSNTSSRTGC